MAVLNSMEGIVDVALSELLKEEPDCCTCDHCMDDMKCLALNALPPKYVSSEKGALFSKINSAMTQQNSIDIRVACINALEFVKSHPHHK
ncbi:MAG: late competence development ComFB family protein [Ruminiclostridium sp.]|nr:late competence development ComFB family protein [Ruminiclostridium sp.]